LLIRDQSPSDERDADCRNHELSGDTGEIPRNASGSARW
jgi:hypothetical protein